MDHLQEEWIIRGHFSFSFLSLTSFLSHFLLVLVKTKIT